MARKIGAPKGDATAAQSTSLAPGVWVQSMPTTGEAAHRSIWGYDDPAIWADYVTGSPTPKDYPVEDGAGDAQPLADFLAARDWGLLRFAETQPDSSPHGRTVLQLLFAGRDEDEKFPIDSDDAAALAYESIVEYLEKHGHNHDAHLERIGIFKIVYGGFRRFKDDLKHDLKKRAKGDPFTGAQPPVNKLIK